MSVDLAAKYTITAPASVDGLGAVAVLNDPADANFVGYLFDSSGFESPEVRESFENLTEADGGKHGSFFYGRRPFTMDVWMEIASTAALTHARLDKLLRATNAMRADGTIVWTETGSSIAKRLSFRRQQAIRGPSQERRCLFAGVCAEARILSDTENASAATAYGSSVTMTNSGNVGSLPRFKLNASVTGADWTITRSSPTPSTSLKIATGGSLTGTDWFEVDFAARTITFHKLDGTVENRYANLDATIDDWWELIPGNNTVAVAATGSGTWIGYHRHAWL